VWQNETLTGRALIGAGLVIGAVTYTAFADATRRVAVAEDAPAAEDLPAAAPVRLEPGRMSGVGVAFGVGSAICIALGAVFARKAFLALAADGRPLDPIVATVVRVVTAAGIFWLLPIFTGGVREVVGFMREGSVRRRMLIGTGCGAISGMVCYLAALRHAPAGLVSTLVSTSTLVVIPLTALRYRTRVPWDVTLAATVAVIGVGMISWK
jgi:drug/metabolite transporter (DMT)-like permease